MFSTEELPDQRPRRRAERLAHADLRRALHDPADVDVDQVHGGKQHEQQAERRQQPDQPPHLALGILAPAGGHQAREPLELGLERGDDRLELLRIGQLDAERAAS